MDEYQSLIQDFQEEIIHSDDECTTDLLEDTHFLEDLYKRGASEDVLNLAKEVESLEEIFKLEFEQVTELSNQEPEDTYEDLTLRYEDFRSKRETLLLLSEKLNDLMERVHILLNDENFIEDQDQENGIGDILSSIIEFLRKLRERLIDTLLEVNLKITEICEKGRKFADELEEGGRKLAESFIFFVNEKYVEIFYEEKDKDKVKEMSGNIQDYAREKVKNRIKSERQSPYERVREVLSGRVPELDRRDLGKYFSEMNQVIERAPQHVQWLLYEYAVIEFKTRGMVIAVGEKSVKQLCRALDSAMKNRGFDQTRFEAVKREYKDWEKRVMRHLHPSRGGCLREATQVELV